MKSIAIALLAALTALRLWLAAAATVTPLEAYYWMCAHRLDWAFFDGPSGTAWLVHLGTLAAGDGSLGVRLAFPLLAALASCGAFLLARSLFGAEAALWAAAAINAFPFFNTAAVHAGPEIPALAFLLLAAWAFLRAMDHGWPRWILAGVLLALATQFHYASILLLPGIAAVCIFSSRHRIEWRRPGLYVLSVVSLCGLVPAFLWNRAHDWPALAAGTLRTALTPRWSEIGSALAADISLFSLTALAALGFTVWTLAREARVHARPRLALCLASPFALLWLHGALHGLPSGAALLLAGAILAGGAAHVFLAATRLRQLGAILLLMTAGFAVLSASGDPWTRSANGVPWREAARSLDELLARAQSPSAPPLLVIAQDPDATAALNYHLAHTAHPEVFLRESQDASNQFALWPRYDDFVETARPPDDFFKQEGSTANPYMGRSALYLTDEDPGDLPQTITGAFRRVAPFAALELAGGRKLRVYLCEDYQTMPL